MQATTSTGRQATALHTPLALGLPLIIAGVVAVLLIATTFFITLQSMNQKLRALDQMMDTLGHMDQRLAQTNQQLIAANHALTITNQRLSRSVQLAVGGNQRLAKTNAALLDLDAQIAKLTEAIGRSHLLKI